MMMYHWSPSSRRSAIIRHGLRVGRKPAFCSRRAVGTFAEDSEGGELVICFSGDPTMAWALSGALPYARHIASWDLWMTDVHVDDLFPLPKYSDNERVMEYRVTFDIPKRDVFYVATRPSLPLSRNPQPVHFEHDGQSIEEATGWRR